MSRPASATSHDPLRALFLCLVVVAQLLLPSVAARASVAQDKGCVTLGTSADAGKGSKQSHLHGQECAHCRPQAVVLAAPIAHPEIAVAPALASAPTHQDPAVVVALLQPLPPATGPPALSSIV